MTIGEKIKSFRNLKQITQKTLAERSGVSEIAIKKYETGERTPKPEQLKKIAKTLNISESVFKINTIELTTVGDALALFFLLYYKLGINVKYLNDTAGNIDPHTITLHFLNNSVNTHIAEWLSNKEKTDSTLDIISQKFSGGKLTREEYEQLYFATKGIIDLLEQACVEDKESLDKNK
jgi:transcriptional regulator with XRE-family HTH domain